MDRGVWQVTVHWVGKSQTQLSNSHIHMYVCNQVTFTGDLLFSCSVTSDSMTPWTAAHQASLSFTTSWSLLKLMSIVSVMLSNHLILCWPLLLLLSIFPSVRVFSNESALHIRYVNWPSCLLHAKPLQWYLTLCDPMDYSLPGSSDHGILQARILEWVVMPSFRESS